jgi:hypothetical protein
MRALRFDSDAKLSAVPVDARPPCFSRWSNQPHKRSPGLDFEWFTAVTTATLTPMLPCVLAPAGETDRLVGCAALHRHLELCPGVG